jgi:hypothetical protein
MNIEDTLRTIVREELSRALERAAPSSKWEGTLKLADAAKLVSVSVTTLEKWGKAGLRIHRKGRVRVVDVAELRAFIASKEATPTQTATDRAHEILGTVTPLRRTR